MLLSCRYGGAEPGDRTMVRLVTNSSAANGVLLIYCLTFEPNAFPHSPQLDALCPAVEELQRLSSSPPTGAMAVLQAAVEVRYSC